MAALKKLRLESNSLTSIGSGIGNSTTLERIYLQFNDITWTIPSELWSI